MKNQVYVHGCDSYNYEQIKQIIDNMFDTLSLNELIRKDMNVVIKPNLLMRSNPNSAIITHPLVTAAVGVRLKELGANVLIAESSGGPYTSATLKAIYNGCGYTEMAEKYGLTLNYDTSYKEISAPNGIRSKSFNIITPILNADLIVDIAKLKSHAMTGLSGATKNIFGTVPGLMKPELHCRFPDGNDFGEMLVDLCEFVKPSICIVDAILAMEGNGPSGGKPRKLGVVYGGESPYNVDIVSCKLANMDPQTIPMMKSAIDRGLCESSVEKLEILGEELDKYVVNDFLQPDSKGTDFLVRVPSIFRPIAKKLTTPKPKIRTKDCVGCGKCAESCPEHTIAIKDRKAVINYSKCIKCFCCHEMCPVRAIDIRRLTLFNL